MSKKLTVDEEGFAEQLMADVAINPNDLDSAYIEQASLFAFYAEQSRLASKKMDNFKLRIDAVEAELDKQFRDEAVGSGSKVTEKAIEQAIGRDPKYVKAVMSYNDAKATAQMLRDVLDAFKNRKDMLICIGNDRRSEFNATRMHLNEDQLTTRRKEAFKKEAA